MLYIDKCQFYQRVFAQVSPTSLAESMTSDSAQK